MTKYIYVKSAFLCESVRNAQVDILDQDKSIIGKYKTDKNGKVLIKNSTKAVYVSIKKAGFRSKFHIIPDEKKILIRLLEDQIIGFHEKLYFNPGDKVKSFISSSVPYKAELIRHGLKNKLIKSLGDFPAIEQEVPNTFFVEQGLNWHSAFSYRIPEYSTPGLYSLKLTPLKSKLKPYFLTYLVSTPENKYGQNSKILVLASSNNWQAYNVWGGRSRYRNFEFFDNSFHLNMIRVLWIKIVPELIKEKFKKALRKKFPITINDSPDNLQFKALSIRRPHPNCSIEEEDPYKIFTSHLTAGEWRLLAWLEFNKLKYDIISGYALHTFPELLGNYKVVVLNTHCEYWSKEMYYGLKKYFDNGGAILNLSGNSIYREMHYVNKYDFQCLSLRFSESVEDETKLIGVRFDMRGYGTCSPFKILEKNHWIFNGVDKNNINSFGEKSLNAPNINKNISFDRNPASSPGIAELVGHGASGWETDKLSTTAPDDVLVIAKGLNKRGGGADMIVRERSNEHGFLFSASSITFAGSLLIDKVSSRIIQNIINKIIK